MFFKKKEFMEWNDYSQRIAEISDLRWRQKTRLQSLRNLLAET